MDRFGVGWDDVFIEPERPNKYIKTYRQDKLESVLPEWCFSRFISKEEILLRWAQQFNKKEVTLYQAEQMSILINKANSKPGEKAMQATVDLVCLLDQEGLLPKEVE